MRAKKETTAVNITGESGRLCSQDCSYLGQSFWTPKLRDEAHGVTQRVRTRLPLGGWDPWGEGLLMIDKEGKTSMFDTPAA